MYARAEVEVRVQVMAVETGVEVKLVVEAARVRMVGVERVERGG